MTAGMLVTVMMDEGTIPADDPDFSAGRPEASTERHVMMALRDLGHRPHVLPVGYDLEPLVRDLTDHRPDIVFNLAEQFGNDRRMDMNVVALLEMMGIPFTGSGPIGMMLCRDKGLCKQLLGLHRIRVPGFVVMEAGQSARKARKLKYPLIVKPVYEDSSTGISLASLVNTEAELVDRVRLVGEQHHQASIVEEYVAGRELYVGVIGNERLTVFPPREIRFGQAGGPEFATSKVKSDEAYRRKWNIEYVLAELDEKLARTVARVCRRTYRLLHVQDYARIDLRVTAEGRVVVLEANPNPDIAYGEDFAESAEKAGVTYNDLIEHILRLALRRAGR